MDTDRTQLHQNPQTQLNQEFNRVLPHHLTEWQNSSVDEQLTTLNLISLSGFVTYDYLLYGLDSKERRNGVCIATENFGR
jgi:hypothetical protein